jgi:hypothetical protein
MNSRHCETNSAGMCKAFGEAISILNGEIASSDATLNSAQSESQ